jgi:hypothetical protein
MELPQRYFSRILARGMAHFRGGTMSGRISIQICIAGAAALVSGIGTNLQATTRANDCLAAPNASAPRGQHWYHRIDLQNNRKCWYLHATLMHRAAKASVFHAVSVAAGTPVSGSRADSAPGLPHTRMLSVKPQPTSLVSAIAEEPIRTDQSWAPQENGPQGSALQVDGSKPTDAVAASSRAAAKPIQQSDAPWAPQENGPQESALQGDGTKPTDAVAASSPAAATPIQQSDAPWAPQENGPQGSAPQFDRSKPTDAVAASSPAAATPTQQSDAPWAPQESDPQGSAPQFDRSKPTDAVAASSPAPATFRVAAADADSARLDADAQAFDDGGRIAERSTRTTQAGILRALSFTPVQMFLLLVFGVASIVFLISLVIIIHRRVTALIDFQLGHDRPDAQAQHGWQDYRADARSSQMFADDRRGQDGADSAPRWMRPSAKQLQNRNATSIEPALINAPLPRRPAPGLPTAALRVRTRS